MPYLQDRTRAWKKVSVTFCASIIGPLRAQWALSPGWHESEKKVPKAGDGANCGTEKSASGSTDSLAMDKESRPVRGRAARASSGWRRVVAATGVDASAGSVDAAGGRR